MHYYVDAVRVFRARGVRLHSCLTASPSQRQVDVYIAAVRNEATKTRSSASTTCINDQTAVLLERHVLGAAVRCPYAAYEHTTVWSFTLVDVDEILFC